MMSTIHVCVYSSVRLMTIPTKHSHPHAAGTQARTGGSPRSPRVILFSLNSSPPRRRGGGGGEEEGRGEGSSLSRVINNGLSFVGFNAAATPHKAKPLPLLAGPPLRRRRRRHHLFYAS